MTPRPSVRTRDKPAKIGGTALLGLALGGIIAIGAQYLIGRTLPAEYAKSIVATPVALEYVEVGRLLMPLVDAEGDLTTYVNVAVSLEVDLGKGDSIRDKLPQVRHEVNLIAWRTPLASGPDGLLLDTQLVERLYGIAATRVYGGQQVHRVLVTAVWPA